MQLEEVFNQDGSIRGVTGEIGAYRRMTESGGEVVTTYSIDCSGCNSTKSVQALIDALRSDIAALSRYVDFVENQYAEQGKSEVQQFVNDNVKF